MSTDWPRMTEEMTAAVGALRKGESAEVMKGFGAIARAALEPKALDTKTKELVALGIAVAVRCEPCVAFHAKAAVKEGASRAEVMETINTAIYMGAGPSVMYGAKALEAYDSFAGA